MHSQTAADMYSNVAAEWDDMEAFNTDITADVTTQLDDIEAFNTEITLEVATHVDGMADVDIEYLDNMFISQNKMTASKFFPFRREFWDHPIAYLFPFLMEPSYVPFGIPDEIEHPGKPASRPLYEPELLEFDYTLAFCFRKPESEGYLETDEIVSVSRLLYHQNPAFDKDHHTIKSRTLDYE